MIRFIRIQSSRPASCFSECVNAWRHNFLCTQFITYLHYSDSVCIHFKNSFHYRRCFGIWDQLLRIVGILHVSICYYRSNTLTALALCTLNRSNLFTCIPCKKIVEIIAYSRIIVCTVGAVYTVVYGDKTDVILRKGNFHKHTRLQIFSAKSRLVFYNHRRNISAFHFNHHFLECRTIKICSGISVVNIEFTV